MTFRVNIYDLWRCQLEKFSSSYATVKCCDTWNWVEGHQPIVCSIFKCYSFIRKHRRDIKS